MDGRYDREWELESALHAAQAINRHQALEIERLTNALEATSRERNYWRRVAEDPGLYWTDDNPPYRLWPDDESEEAPGESEVAVPLSEIAGVDHYYTDEGLFRDEPPTPLDATRIASMLHIITRHKRGWQVEISSDGCYGSGQYQVVISPTCRPIGDECGRGWDDTIESALDWAMGDIDELRPFVEDGRDPEGGDDVES